MPTGCINKTTEYAWIEYSGIFCSSHGTAVPCILKKLQAVQDYLAGKGKRISDYSDDDILAVELWANNLPRKVLGYKTPDEAFEAEMDTIFAA